MFYRKKPIVIEAVQFNGSNHHQLADWSGEAVRLTESLDKLEIVTLEGTMTASLGDYIVKGIKGEFYPCKPDIFEANHDKAD
jgi:predicted KAP-like P-loop ATPase